MELIKSIFSLLWDITKGLVGLVFKKKEPALPTSAPMTSSAPTPTAPTPQPQAPRPAASQPAPAAPAQTVGSTSGGDPFTILTDEPEPVAVPVQTGPRIIEPAIIMPPRASPASTSTESRVSCSIDKPAS